MQSRKKSPCWRDGITFGGNDNPWIVGESSYENEEGMDCRRECAINDTCYQANWDVSDAVNMTCTYRDSVVRVTKYWGKQKGTCLAQ